jgi:hypothetical protein
MQLIKSSHSILSQLASLVEQIDENDYSKPCPTLGNSSIGQHVRHTLEFFLCLESGCGCGLVNYDKRAHDQLIERDKFIAVSTINRIKEFVADHHSDFNLKLEVGYSLDEEESLVMETNYFRELTYNIEHAVHHMAIIKIGVRELANYVQLPAEFGIAASTIRYKETSMASSR